MSKWRPIVYREFYDVPCAIIVSDGSRNYLFTSSFDEALDAIEKITKFTKCQI
jgi:hypothetical protein